MTYVATANVDAGSEELQWLAFQYISGELSAQASEAFEQQKLIEPTLCQLVTDVTRLSLAIARHGSARRVPAVSARVLPASRVVSASEANGRRQLVAVVSICTCLMLVVMVSGILVKPADSLSVNAKAELLVDVWSMGDSLVPQLQTEYFTSDAADDSEFAQQVLEVPEWLLAAVTMEDLGERLESAPQDADPDDRDLF